MNNTMVNEEFTTRCQKVIQVAKEIYQRNPDWVTFFRELLGVNGAARTVFPTQEEYVEFEKSPQHAEIQKMITSLRNRKITNNNHNESTRVITVRLPESLHEALKAEAADHKTSMNKLCISKLLQVLSEVENKANLAATQRQTAAPAPQVAHTPQPATPSPIPSHSTPSLATPASPPTQSPNHFRSNY